MSKQEEIRKGMYQIASETKTTCIYGDIIEDLLKYLHSQGVVIKVERELPIPEYMYLDGHSDTHYITQNAFATGVSKDTQKKMLKAGYVAVEPLIEE